MVASKQVVGSIPQSGAHALTGRVAHGRFAIFGQTGCVINVNKILPSCR